MDCVDWWDWASTHGVILLTWLMVNIGQYKDPQYTVYRHGKVENMTSNGD